MQEQVVAWQRERRRARLFGILNGSGAELPCVQHPLPFLSGEREDETQAKRLCVSCPVRGLCLGRALSEEHGLRTEKRFGVRGGKTPIQRFRISRAKGCAVCGVDLPEGSSSLYCKPHQHSGERSA